jgi:hypothetical protein
MQILQHRGSLARRLAARAGVRAAQAARSSRPQSVEVMERIRKSTRTQGKRYERHRRSRCSPSRIPPNLDSHMRRPRHVTLVRRWFGPSDPNTQTLRAVERRGVTHDFPLALLVSEPIADLDVHRQNGNGRRIIV